MVTISANNISINLPNEDSAQYIEHLKEALLIAIQQLDYESCPPDQAQFVNYHLGDLLKQLCVKESSFD